MPLHPLIVHFPIVFLIVAAVAYGVYAFQKEDFYLKAATYLHMGGIVAIALAIITGNIAESAIEHPPVLHEMIEKHGLMSWICVWGYGLLYVWQMLRIKRFEKVELWAFVILMLVFTGIMGYSAHIGGEMVYLQGAGVQCPK